MFWTEGKSMKKRQQGDDENKKKEMVMTTLQIRSTIDSIKHTRSNSKFRSIDKSRQKQKPHRCIEMSEEGN
jgi:hypothetical protein